MNNRKNPQMSPQTPAGAGDTGRFPRRQGPSSTFAALLFLVVGVGLLAGAGLYYVVVRPQTWPRAEAVVVSSRVVNPGEPVAASAGNRVPD